MTKLHGVIGNRPELVFIYDRCSAIKRAVLKAFQIVSHRVCFYHVKGKLSLNSRCLKLFGINLSQSLLIQQRRMDTKNLKGNLRVMDTPLGRG